MKPRARRCDAWKYRNGDSALWIAPRPVHAEPFTGSFHESMLQARLRDSEQRREQIKAMVNAGKSQGQQGMQESRPIMHNTLAWVERRKMRSPEPLPQYLMKPEGDLFVVGIRLLFSKQDESSSISHA